MKGKGIDMDEKWVVTVKRSAPKEFCGQLNTLKTELWIADSFSAAKDRLHAALKGIVRSGGAMFKKDGTLVSFKRYLDESDYEYEEDREGGEMVLSALKNIMNGESTDLEGFEDIYDGCIAVTYDKGVLEICGDDDGPCNGIDPRIATNMANMSRAKDYYLFIEDQFDEESVYYLSAEIRKAKSE